MPSNKKKSKQKQKKKGGGNSNLNAEALEALTRLADSLAGLDEARDPRPDAGGGSSDGDADGVLSRGTASLSLDPPPPLPLSHWRTLPVEVESAYALLDDGANYIHATSTKYTLVGKVDAKEGGNLASELQKGAQLIGTGTLLLFSPTCGSSRSLRHYAKQHSRAVLASVISLVTSFEDGTARGAANDGNNVGAQRTGAVWSSCDKLTKNLPRGNRAAMRRELMTWARDCNESIGEFDEVLALGPRDDDGGEDKDDMVDEEQYAEAEMGVARASVNVMKCSRNLLGLVLKACECAGDLAEKLLKEEQEVKSALLAETETRNPLSPLGEGEKSLGAEIVAERRKTSNDDDSESSKVGDVENARDKPSDEDDATSNGQSHLSEEDTNQGPEMAAGATKTNGEEPETNGAKKSTNTKQEAGPHSKKNEVLQWIGGLHGIARTVGEGVTDLGILLYPPLDRSRDQEELDGRRAGDEGADPSLGSTSLGLGLERQLRALSECAAAARDACLQTSGESIRECMSEDVTAVADRLVEAVEVRRREVERAVRAWDMDVGLERDGAGG